MDAALVARLGFNATSSVGNGKEKLAAVTLGAAVASSYWNSEIFKGRIFQIIMDLI